MRTLLILRHAKSSWRDHTLEDHDRPLNKRGKKDAPRMGELIKNLELTPDLILSSTAKRAQATAKIVAKKCNYGGQIRLMQQLYAAGPEIFIPILNEITDEYQRVMLIAHNPGLEEFIALLTSEIQHLPTAALAQIDLPIEKWEELNHHSRGKLVMIWRPKEI